MKEGRKEGRKEGIKCINLFHVGKGLKISDIVDHDNTLW
jgi:hypothetical protein